MVHLLRNQPFQGQNHHDLQACSQPMLTHYSLKNLSIRLQKQSLPPQVLQTRINKASSVFCNYSDRKLQTYLGTTLENLYRNRSLPSSVIFLITNYFLSNSRQSSVKFAKNRYQPGNSP